MLRLTISFRPLGIGEVLDRAVSLCIWLWASLAAIEAAFAVPYALSQFRSGSNLGADVAGAITDLHQYGSLQRHAHAGRPLWMSLVDLLVYLVLAPLVSGALVATIGSAYSGGGPSVRRAFRTALKRLWPLVLCGISTYASLLVLLVAVDAVAFGARSLPAGIWCRSPF